ncbi:MAG: hypothetical protein Q8O55_00755 [Dehalococcoidales bacterium]|nr:hypothetical protein [Dehalococcoidales bacterium]
MPRLAKIILYDEGADKALHIEEIAEYLNLKMKKVEIEIKGSPFSSSQDKALEYARKIAGLKIQNATRILPPEPEPLYGEIEYEKRRILGKTKAFGVLYEGTGLQRIFWELIPREERNLSFAHILFSNRLFATWEESDRRYHARVSVYGIPTMLSTTGVVEAPAKPREYYLLKQQYEMLRKDLLELNDMFRGRFIGYEDERMTEVMKGYAMQAVFYSLTGNPFCEDRGCRLYNAHWQEEVIHGQIDSQYEFCPEHTAMIEALNDF